MVWNDAYKTISKSELGLFDELDQCDEEGILGEVRKAADGK